MTETTRRTNNPPSAPEHSVVRNSFFNGLGFLWSALVLFFQVTYILRSLGAEVYGIWALCLILSSSIALADFGISATIVKFVSEHRAKGEGEEVNRILMNGLLFYCAIDALLLLLLPLLGPAMGFLGVPDGLRPLATLSATIALATFMITMTGVNVLTGLLQGYHRMDVTSSVTMIVGVPKIGGTIAAVELGYGLPGVMISDLAMVLLTVLLLRRRASTIAPEAVFSWRFRSLSTFKRLFRFGITLQASMFSGLVNFHFDKLVLSKMLGLQFLTYYDLGSRIVGKIRGLPLIAATALLPEFSRLHALQNVDAIGEMYHKSSKVMLIFLLPLFGTVAMIAGLFVDLWLGPGYDPAALTLRVLAFSYCVNVFTAVVSNVSKGLGHPEIEAKTALIQVLLNVLLSPVLVLVMGFPGALIGTSTALIGGAWFYLSKVHALLKIRSVEFATTIIRRPLLYSAASLLGAGAVLFGGIEAGLAESFAGTTFLLLGVSAVSVGLFFILLFKSSYIDPEEKHRLAEAVRRMIKRSS